MVEYTRKEFLELYKNLPRDLKNAMGSDKTVNLIERLSNQEELGDEEHSSFVKLVGDALIGLLPPSEFEKALKEKANIKEESARKINQAVQSFIFYPVRETLSELYQEEMEIKESEKKKRAPAGKDKYREPIEK